MNQKRTGAGCGEGVRRKQMFPQAESKEGCCPFNNQFLNKECQSPWYCPFHPNPQSSRGKQTPKL